MESAGMMSPASERMAYIGRLPVPCCLRENLACQWQHGVVHHRTLIADGTEAGLLRGFECFQQTFEVYDFLWRRPEYGVGDGNMGRVHHGNARIADVACSADQALHRRQVVLRRTENPGDRIHRATVPAIEHQLGCEIKLLVAAGRGSEAKGAGEVAGNRAADRAMDP